MDGEEQQATKRAQKAQMVQLTLVKVMEEEEEQEPIRKTTAEFFELKAKPSAIASVIKKHNKFVEADKEEDARRLLLEFVQKKMRPIAPTIEIPLVAYVQDRDSILVWLREKIRQA